MPQNEVTTLPRAAPMHTTQFSPDQVELIKRTICKGASDDGVLSSDRERLQGLPDGYTDVPYRGKPAADGPRYRAIGNSMAVPVVRWIGERIAAFEAQP